MGGLIRGFILVLLCAILLFPVHGFDVNYIEDRNYYSSQNYFSTRYVSNIYDHVEYEDFYDGYRTKKDHEVNYYCNYEGDILDQWIECENPFYVEGIRLSETLKRKGFNWNPTRKRNPYNPYGRIKKPIKIVYV